VAGAPLDAGVIGQQLPVVVPGGDERRRGREDAEAATQPGHTNVVSPVMRHAALMDALPDLAGRPGMDREPFVDMAFGLVVGADVVAEKVHTLACSFPFDLIHRQASARCATIAGFLTAGQ
jgi:hypothetical protein